MQKLPSTGVNEKLHYLFDKPASEMYGYYSSSPSHRRTYVMETTLPHSALTTPKLIETGPDELGKGLKGGGGGGNGGGGECFMVYVMFSLLIVIYIIY